MFCLERFVVVLLLLLFFKYFIFIPVIYYVIPINTTARDKKCVQVPQMGVNRAHVVLGC